MKNKIIAGFLSTALLLSPLSAHADEAVHLSGKLVDGRVYMPLRAAGAQIGAITTWNQKTQTATVNKDGKVLEVKLGEFVKMFDNRVYVQFRDSTKHSLSKTISSGIQLIWLLVQSTSLSILEHWIMPKPSNWWNHYSANTKILRNISRKAKTTYTTVFQSLTPELIKH